MSNHLKSSLLAATTLFAMTASQANAGVVFPAADIQVAGATTVQDVLPREANCIGGTKFATAFQNSYTVNADKLVSARNLGNLDAFNGTPAFDCATQNIQPNLTLHYIGTGSGTGKNLLSGSSFQTTYGAISYSTDGGTTTTSVGFPDPAKFGVDVSTWTGLHAAFSDSLAAASTINAFNTNKADAKAYIQVPLYVVPIAVAYAPVYAQQTSGAENTLAFNVANPVTVGATPVGGLRLSKAAYCGIFNGYITNWNDATIAAANYNSLYTTKDVIPAGKKVGDPKIVPLFDPRFDNATRWAAEGAPVRLVGRLDKSGTTSIFSRHLTAVCGTQLGANTNKFTAQSEILPYNAASALDLRSFRFDSPYQPATTSSAGTTNLISGIVYGGEGTGTGQGFVSNGTGSVTTETTAPTGAVNGNGLYILASGGGNVRSAVASFTTATTGSVYSKGNLIFNGKIGYISADNVLPAATKGGLNAAALEVGETFAIAKEKKKLWATPTALTATAAFGDVLPPATDKKGVYTLKGTKKADGLTYFSRTSPSDWYDVLYANTKINKKGGLADPQVGYALTGTTQLNTGTCFASPATRNAVAATFSTLLGYTTKTSTDVVVSPSIFTGVNSPDVSVRAQAGLAPLPATWRTAIYNTFFSYDAKTVNGLSTKKTKLAPATTVALFIQNGLPTKQTKADALPANGATSAAAADAKTGILAGFGEAEANPSCTAAKGL